MTWRKLMGGGVAILLAVGCMATAQAPPPAQKQHCLRSQDYRTLAVRAGRSGKQVLAVDTDGRVLLLSTGEGGTVSEVEPLGYEQVMPQDFPFASLLPKEEALISLRRVSCADQHWRLWIALTTGFIPQETRQREAFPLRNTLIILREPAGPDGKPMLLQDDFREVFELTVDDVNGDGRTEIAVQYADAVEGPWMKIWQIGDNGALHSIPLDNIKKDLTAVPGHVDIGLGDYRHGGELLFTEQRLQTAKGWHVTRRFYDWDDAHQHYLLSEVVQSDEITIK